MEEQIVTDDVVVTDNDSDATTGLETEVTEGTQDETPETPADGTAPVKADAEQKESAKLAWKLRNERRAREAAEAKALELETRLNTPVVGKPVPPDYAQFESNEEYNKAVAQYHENLTDWKLQERDAKASTYATQKEYYDRVKSLENSYVEKAEKAVEKYPDYIEVVESNTEFSPYMKEAIFKSENSAEIAYHIGKNQELHDKLMTSSPIDVAIEIHKMDLKFKQKLNQKSVSSASEPISPVEGKSVELKKDPSKMSINEYMEHEKQLRIAKAKQRYGG